MHLGVGLLVALAASTVARFDWDAIDAVYAFGDSYSFVGGTRGRANFSFIGDALDVGFTPRELLTNEIIPKNTSSSGSNWLEFLTGCFSGSPLRCRRQLWDFAFAGADIDDSLLPRHHDFTLSLTGQVEQYLTYAKGVIPRTKKGSTMVAWWIGINDTGDTISSNVGDFDAFWESEMELYFGAVQRIHDSNLASTHLFINVPPGDRSPSALGNDTRIAVQKSRIAGFNTALARHVQQFQARNKDAKVLAFDAHEWFNFALDHASQLGFKNITGFCECADPTFFWLNTGHPTEPVHRLLAEALKTQLRRTVTV